MNKKYLIFSSTIIIILLACFAIAEISGITLNAPADEDVINGTYTFNTTITGIADNVSFYSNNPEWTLICFNDTASSTDKTFICDNNSIQLSDGTYTFNAIGRAALLDEYTEASDISTNVIVDNTFPVINLNDPINNLNTPSTNISFDYTPSDVLLHTCYLTWNVTEQKNITNLTSTQIPLLNGSQNNFFQTNLPEGHHTWNITCNDTLKRINSSETRTLTIDWTDPVITSTGVANDSEYDIDQSINCNCTATDNLDNEITCSGTGCNTNSAGQKTATFTATDRAGNFHRVTANYTVLEEPPAEGEAESEGEAEGEGEGEGEPEPRTEEKCWDILEAGATIDYEVDNEEIGIRKITIIPNKALSNTCLKVKQVISITTAGVTKYSEDNKVYKYFQIEPTGISDEDLTSVNIEFSIAKSFFYDHHRDTTNLNRYKEGWEELDTEDLSQDEINYAFFEAESPGFSDFVIVSDKRITGETVGTGPGCGDGICDPDENSTTCCQDCGCALGFECINNSCEKSSKFIVFQWFERAYNDVKEWIEEKIKFDWIGNKWWLGLPVWAWIIVGAVIVATGILGFIFRKKIKFPFEINFSVHKKHYGFR